MSYKLISALLAFFLIGVAVSPSLFVAMDEKVEISLFENSEKEKESRGEHKLEMESLLLSSQIKVEFSKSLYSKKYSGNCSFFYPIPYLSLHSPPPELV